MKRVNAALACASTIESATRRLGLSTLWHAAGRSSETACITWDVLEWDEEFSCVFVEVAQSKTSKVKIIALTAGTPPPIPSHPPSHPPTPSQPSSPHQSPLTPHPSSLQAPTGTLIGFWRLRTTSSCRVRLCTTLMSRRGLSPSCRATTLQGPLWATGSGHFAHRAEAAPRTTVTSQCPRCPIA